MLADPVITVSQFVALLNQSLEFAYPSVVISGELANLRISKAKWLYFDLKDQSAIVRFFGSVYQLPGPLENGMMLKVRGQPRLHNLYGFSVNIMNIQPLGEGSIRKAADLLADKLKREGLFDTERKRPLPYPPASIGLITSVQSAAYADFIKVLAARWSGLTINMIDVQVQGEAAIAQIIQAIEQINEMAEPPEVVVLIRGGGSAEDLAVFNVESVVRAVAASRVPTLVAIGHETDISLAELAADQRASTPSNAAELLTPDKQQVSHDLVNNQRQLHHLMQSHLRLFGNQLKQKQLLLGQFIRNMLKQQQSQLSGQLQLLGALSPVAVLARGYAIVRLDNRVMRSGRNLRIGTTLDIEMVDSQFSATVKTLLKKVKIND